MVLVPSHLHLNFILIFKTKFLLQLSKWNTEELHYYLGKIDSATLRTSQCSRLGWDSIQLPNSKFLSRSFQHSLNPNRSSWEATKRAGNFMIVSSQMKNFKVFTVLSWIELRPIRKSFSHHLSKNCKSNNNTFHKKLSWVKLSQICLKNGKQECSRLLRKRGETIRHLKLSI
jgi:hypothetical protein